MPTNYSRGREAEYRTCRVMEKRGYRAQRSAGSHGDWDVVAWDFQEVVFISVKRESAEDDRRLADMPCPRYARRLLHHWRKIDQKWQLFETEVG